MSSPITPASAPLPTFTLSRVTQLIPPPRPTKLNAGTIASSAVLTIAILIVIKYWFNGNPKRQDRVFRKDIEDCDRWEDFMTDNEDEILRRWGGGDAGVPLATPHPGDPILPTGLWPVRSGSPTLIDSSTSPKPPTARPWRRSPSPPAVGFSTFLSPPPAARNNRISAASHGSSEWSELEDEVNSENMGFGYLGPGARSRLDLGSVWEGSVARSRVVDRRVEGDYY